MYQYLICILLVTWTQSYVAVVVNALEMFVTAHACPSWIRRENISLFKRISDFAIMQKAIRTKLRGQV